HIAGQHPDDAHVVAAEELADLVVEGDRGIPRRQDALERALEAHLHGEEAEHGRHEQRRGDDPARMPDQPGGEAIHERRHYTQAPDPIANASSLGHQTRYIASCPVSPSCCPPATQPARCPRRSPASAARPGATGSASWSTTARVTGPARSPWRSRRRTGGGAGGPPPPPGRGPRPRRGGPAAAGGAPPPLAPARRSLAAGRGGAGGPPRP